MTAASLTGSINACQTASGAAGTVWRPVPVSAGPAARAVFSSAAAGRGVALDKVYRAARDGHTGERPRGEIGFAVLRGGDVAGEHSVVFAGEGERIVLSHIAGSRKVFAAGAVRAALWTQNRPAGLYSMKNVLGFDA